MTTIKNNTRKPLSVPLPGGKRLFLGPGKTGQIGPKAADHPPLAELVAAGDLEIVPEGGALRSRDGNAGSSGPAGQGHTPGKVFRGGDR